MKLTEAQRRALVEVRDVPRIIPDESLRAGLKRLGLIRSAPLLRKYRQMPYAITPAGRRALDGGGNGE